MEYRAVHIHTSDLDDQRIAVAIREGSPRDVTDAIDEALGGVLNGAAKGGWRLVTVSGKRAYFERPKGNQGTPTMW